MSRQFLADFGPPPGEGPKARPLVGGLARHGIAGPVGQVANGGRYGRLFPELDASAWSEAELKGLAHALTALKPSTDNFSVPSGYTYFGQFVDHDSTFDPTSRLRRKNDVAALVDYRSPALDLDSLYGSGPMDQPYMYDWNAEPAGVKLLLGACDLPRNAQGRALIGDPRNDENLIVSQLQQLMLRFHNKLVDELAGSFDDGAKLFEEVQRRVRWHYQWIVIEDFLPRIAGAETAAAVYQRPEITCAFYTCTVESRFMPVEFSGAAYRFGHSMVRDDYKLNDATPNVPLFVARAGDDGRRLEGNRPLPRELVIEWKHFLPTTGERPQASKLIDPSLSAALYALPPDAALLPRLNLLRGYALRLPSGQSVAARIGVAPLTGEELLSALPELSPALKDKVQRDTPLWLYVLAEAKVAAGGKHLGPAGGRIVAEVLAGMLAADPSSFVNAKEPWTPQYASTLTELAAFVGDAAP